MNTLFGKKSRGKGQKNVYHRQNLQKPDANCRAVLAQVRLQGGEQSALLVCQSLEQTLQGAPAGGEWQGSAGAEIGPLAGGDIGQIQKYFLLVPGHWMARSLSQLGRALALMLDTMPMAAYSVRMDEPP